MVSEDEDIKARIESGATILNVSGGKNTAAIVRKIKSLYPDFPVLATGGPTEETIREKALILLRDEVPHGIFVQVEKMKLKKTQKNEDIYNIEATIYCLRNSHKGIIIGKNGEMLKRIGTMARKDMEQNFGTKVNLKTWVKVKEDWMNNEKFFNE